MARPFKGTTFWDRVWLNTRITDGDCIEFTGSKNHDGYGRINRGAKLVFVHREVWREHNGNISSGFCVRHSCDNPSCININHLSIGTHTDNMRDMSLRGRKAIFHGSDSPVAKLDEEKVRQIKKRLALGHTQAEIARDFGVSRPNIGYIKRGLNWKHVR